MPDKLTDMKFDYIVMNPPYTIPGDKKLHYRFLQKACEIAETVVSIQPDTWLHNERENPVLDLRGRGADINVISDTEHLFGEKTNLGYKLTITTISSSIKGISMRWDGKDRTEPVGSFKELDFTKKYGDILSGIKSIGIPGDSVYNHALTNGNSSGGASNKNRVVDPSVLAGKWVVRLAPVIPNRERRPNNFGVMNINPNKPTVFQHNGQFNDKSYLIFDTEEEARNCFSYLASDAARSFAIAYKQGSNSGVVLRYIPWPAGDRPFLTGDWSNEAVSDRFGLSREERKWLAEMLPDCYHVR